MGKKSGPLAFLNKKGWHPGNMRNQEKVWKKEQEALAEQKQVDELRKQYEEARQREEMEAMAVAAGVKKKDERLDWMYQGGMVAKQEAQKRADAQLLGEKEVELKAAEETSKAEQLSQLPSFYTTDTPASANEMWQRLHGDPMFAIKQQELSARKKIVANPVQMDAIRRALQEKAAAKAAKKAAKKAKKEAKKAKKEKKRERRDADSSDSGSDSDRSPKRPRTELPPAAAPPRGRLPPVEPGHKERSSHRDRSPRNGHHRERSPRNGHRHEKRSPEAGHRSSRRDEREPDRHETKGQEGARSDGYGIRYADGRGHEDRSEARQATEARLREAAERKAAEEREKAEQRYVRREYRPGGLSAEEKAARLAEMSGNAAVHEEARWRRLAAARRRSDAEQAAEDAAREAAAAANAAPGGRHHADTARFLSAATQEAYGGKDASLADRVVRRKYYSERGGGGDEGGGFARPS